MEIKQDRIKVLEIIPNLGNGGAEKLVVDLMTNFDKSKIDATLLLYYDDFDSRYYKLLKEQGVKIITLGKKSGLDIKLVFKLYKVIKRLNPDVLHSHLYVNLYLLPYYFFNKKQVGYHTVHSIAKEELRGYLKKIMKWLYEHRKVTPVGIGDFVSKSIVEEYNLKKEIPTIYNGIDTTRYIKKNTKDKASNIIEFIAVGTLYHPKNYPLMVNAFKRTYNKHNNIKLNILGSGEDKDSIQKLINELNLNEVVKLLGNVNNVEDYLAHADCFLMSSNFEGLPLSGLEAMSCGLPIIGTKAGGIIDIVKENENGYLSEINDIEGFSNNINKIIENNNFKSFGEKSYELSKQYDIKDCVKNYEKLFNKFKE